MGKPKRFNALPDDAGRGRAIIRIPFDPDAWWGDKPNHHVRGTVAGGAIRGPLRRHSEGWVLPLGPAWLAEHPLPPGKVPVVLEAEGPQTGDLPADVAAALRSSPQAADFFAGLATFYRKGYLRWLDGAARRPDVRAQRIRELVSHLEEGRKERPR